MDSQNKGPIRELGVLPLRNSVLFPDVIMPLAVGRPRSLRAVDDATEQGGLLFIPAQRTSEIEDPTFEDLHEFGTVARVLKVLKVSDESMSVIVQGLKRARMRSLPTREPYLRASLDFPEEIAPQSIELEAEVRQILTLFEQVVSMSQSLSNDLAETSRRLADTPGRLADFVAFHLESSLEDKQHLLETLDVEERLTQLLVQLNRESEVLEVGSKIQSRVMKEVGKSQREFYLREQMKAIQKELGEDDDRNQETEELRAKIEEAGMPEEAKTVAIRELDRLAKMHPSASEYTVSRTFLDWLVALPWSNMSTDEVDIAHARVVLDEDHFGLEKVKERVLEYLAVKKLKSDMKGPILCFVGPPGVGKTSLGRSIARALGRSFHRVSLGGIRDEAEIRGHRRTYVGALPGRIIQGIRKAGTSNPVFMLDELDKVGLDYRGDPTSALLEALDPEQNHAFSDHYLEVAFDLSKVLFIATANLLDPIPAALRDRLEIIELPGYTEEQKLDIARRYIVPKQLTAHGLTADDLVIEDEALRTMISDYTREAGLRNLEREVATVCRKVARKIAEENEERAQSTVAIDDLHGFLGPARFWREMAERLDRPGVATGLAWTQVGGDILFIEANKTPGRGDLILTGHLGDVMKESARAALTYLKSRQHDLGIPADAFKRSDIHVHVPAGAIPKDGPSAGLAMATALLSLLTGSIVDHRVAMTGEATLRGKVLPVGGIKEKVLAGARAGVTTLILPSHNKKDLEDIPDEVRKKITFHFVNEMDEAFGIAMPGLDLKKEVPDESHDRDEERATV